ncbi:hypothetical protein RHSIM_Rhsim05G0210000 [Rhododendron simsii]|uniref:Uncharacterized protein n=1 Tax=Rhododendron simsii TaxID=118357 RepID=A0A834GYZ0_RHOSS|nr:hypothetical protein RHSIM_Rhsim05G0210000 [Rhododendron simsii]
MKESVPSERLLSSSFSEYIPKEAKNIPEEEGQEGKRNGASTSSDLSTLLLQVPSTRHLQAIISIFQYLAAPLPLLSLSHTHKKEPPRDRIVGSEGEMNILRQRTLVMVAVSVYIRMIEGGR